MIRAGVLRPRTVPVLPPLSADVAVAGVFTIEAP